MNPLLSQFNTPFNTIPFQEIKAEYFDPAFEQAFREAREQVQAIVSDTDEPDFTNTIVRLEEAGERLNDLAAILFNLNHAETNDAIQKLAAGKAPELTKFRNEISHDPLLFARVKAVAENTSKYSLTGEQKMLLDNTLKSFIRSGAGLGAEEKQTYKTITCELSGLTIRFNENVLAETNSFFLHLTGKEDLEGLPESIVQAAAVEAANRNKAGWIFTLQFPSFGPFMKYSVRRHLREQLYKAYHRRGLNGNSNDNREIICKIVSLRSQLSSLLGFRNYAEYVLDNRMAETSGKVYSFLDQLKAAYLPVAQKELNEIREYARLASPGIELASWDLSFYSEKLREQKFSITDESIRPYFELEHTVKMVFELATRLYGIQFIARTDIQVYNEEVRVYGIQDDAGRFLAILYLDFFPRQGKKQGAWMTGFREQFRRNGEDIRPHVSLVFNFPRPAGCKPSLLNYSELRTLLHEFGHALHGVFSQVNYKSLSGTSVYRDFVELPSQIMENWAEQARWLERAGIHYETGESIDEEMIHNLVDSRNFNEGIAGCRQLSFGYLDMAWHSLGTDFEGDPLQFEEEVVAPVSLLPKAEGTASSPAFSHIFGGGYAAGYYGYKWAEVLDADAFSRFKEKGIFNRDIAAEFRTKILSKGGTQHPMELFTDFMKREPSIDALLRRSGLA
jgi:peptidyl-dipeptidase Dcp